MKKDKRIEELEKRVKKLEGQFLGLAEVFKGILEVAHEEESGIIKAKNIMEV